MFDAKVRQALPTLPGQAPRWGTWLEFFGGKILHAFCRHRGALLSGNEDSGKWLNQENWSTFYLVNNSDTTTFFDDKKLLFPRQGEGVQGAGRGPTAAGSDQAGGSRRGIRPYQRMAQEGDQAAPRLPVAHDVADERIGVTSAKPPIYANHQPRMEASLAQISRGQTARVSC
ncbi:hypothetical protein PG984_007592 [Apiospora sp. TS-2023a]